jgi:hypothetical protein
MAKNTKTTKLELIPATATASTFALCQPAEEVKLPAKLKKLTLPPLVKPEQVAVGSILSGEIVALAASISGREDMRQSKLIHLRHESGTEFLFPLTGVIKKALGGESGVTDNIGKMLFIQRQPDGETMKYAAKGEGPKKVFMFDVYLGE